MGFKFAKNHWPNSEKIPWQIIPVWIDPKKILNEQYKTEFVLPISKKTELLQKITDEVNPEKLQDRSFLFLRNIREIQIHDKINEIYRKITKSDNISKSEDYEIFELKEFQNGSLEQTNRWIVFSSTCDVPEYVKKDWVTKDWGREKVKQREVLSAFRLDENDKLIEEIGTAHIGPYSFFPLQEDSGLKFSMQADFLTAPNREKIHRDSLWNEWLAKEIYGLIIKKCIPIFLRRNEWKMSFTKLLYPEEGEPHPIFDEHIKNPLKEYLNKKPVLIAESGKPIKISNAISIDSNIRELITKSELKSLHCKEILHPDCKYDMQVDGFDGFHALMDFIIDKQTQKLLKQKAKTSNIHWFKKLYRKLRQYNDNHLRKNLNYENIILTDENKLAQPKDDVYIKPSKLHIPKEIISNFTIVHQNLTRGSKDTLRFLEILGIKKLTDTDIRIFLELKEFPKLRKKWASLPEEDKITNTRICKELWENGKIEVKNLSFLTLKTKTAHWLEPKEIVFSKEYNPTHNIEELINKDLLDIPFEFLDILYLKKDEHINSWHRFFEELGVDEKIEQINARNRIIQRIGVKLSLLYESKKGRKAKELCESEKPGYDIESEGRLIETKGSGDYKPAIFLSSNEFRTFQLKTDRYFVYVVKDALRNPILCITKGTKLNEVTDPMIIIKYNQWKSLIEETFQP